MDSEKIDILKICDECVTKIIKDRETFVTIFKKHCSDSEVMKEKFGSLLLEKSDVYDTKEGLNNLLANKIQEVLKDFYAQAIIGDGSFIHALDETPRVVRTDIMNELKDTNLEMHDIIKKYSFDFEDIVYIDDRGIQKVMRDIDQQCLATALKGANEEVCNKIYSNMSKRAASMLQEDMEFMGPVPKDYVEECRDKICAIILKLEENGDLIIAKGKNNSELIC